MLEGWFMINNDSDFLNIKSQSVIDWFKFSINMPFDRNNGLIRELFKVLTLNIDEFEDDGMTNQYGHKYNYGEYFVVLTDPKASSNIGRIGSGLNYFFVDMSGNACREFESRCRVYNSSWKKLHNFIFSLPYHFTRYDIAKDDLSSIMNLTKLQHKIENREYTSGFRATAKSIYVPIFPEDSEKFMGIDSPVIFRKLQPHNQLSWSATFGTRQGVQLQFYDKLTERAFRGIKVPYDQWIRVEMRFRDKKADLCFVQSMQALNNDDFDNYSSSLLLGLIDLKQSTINGKVRSRFDTLNADKYDRWDEWQNFISVKDPLKISSCESVVPTSEVVEHMSLWDHTASAQTLALMFASSPEHFHDFCDLIVSHYLEKGKFTNKQKEYVNALRRKFDKKELKIEDFNNLFDGSFTYRKNLSKKERKELKENQKEEVLNLIRDTFVSGDE